MPVICCPSSEKKKKDFIHWPVLIKGSDAAEYFKEIAGLTKDRDPN